MRCWWIAALLCVPQTAAQAEDELDIPGLDAADLRGDAMMWEDATIYLEPYETSVTVKFNSFNRRRDEVGRSMPVRIVDSSLKNFVEIAAPGRADCSWRKLDVDARIEGLRMFVRREDLAPVLVKPYAMQWSDGTRIKLAVGMPVTPTSTGDYLVSLRNDKLRVAVPHASVGYIYKAGKISDPELPKEKVAFISRSANVKIGDDGFLVRSNWYGQVPDKKTDVALIKLAARCLEMTVQAPTNSLRIMEMPRPYHSTLPPPPPVTGWRIPAGTPLSTPSGREVAVAGKDIAVQLPAPGPEPACFDARLAMTREDETYGNSNRTVKLCAPGSTITK